MTNKQFYIGSFLCLLSLIGFAQNQVGINTSTVAASAVLEMNSTTSGFLIPRMSSNQRRNIVNPATGLWVYETNSNSLWYYGGSGWVEIIFNNLIPDGLGDNDADTRIFCEFTADQDQIRFYQAGTEYLRMRNNARFEYRNTGNSVFMGDGAGAADDLSNNQNIMIGASAGASNTTGARNVVLGYQAYQTNLTQLDNVAVGSRAIFAGTGARRNVSIGSNTLEDDITRDNMVALGHNALRDHINGANTVAIGSNALEVNTGSASTVAMGTEALGNINNADITVAIGYRAGYNANVNSSVYLGYQAGARNGNQSSIFIDNTDTNSPLLFGELDPNDLTVNGNFHVAQNITFTGTIADVSDRRLKRRLKVEHDVMPRLKRLKSYRYNLKINSADEKEYGLIAQEVQLVFSSLVKPFNQDYMGINYKQFIPLILQAEKEQYQELKDLKVKAEQQATERKLLLGEIKQLKAQLEAQASK